MLQPLPLLYLQDIENPLRITMVLLLTSDRHGFRQYLPSLPALELLRMSRSYHARLL